MTKVAEELFIFEDQKNKVINKRPINYSDHYSDKYFNISMIQEIIDGVITNEVDKFHLNCTSIKATEFIWQRDISNSYNVYKHLKIYGDNSNFKVKYSLNDTNVIELPISNNQEFYMYLSDDHATLSVKCQDLWYKITVTDQNTLTYTTSENSDFNLLPSPEKNNIVYKDDLDRYSYSKIKVGDNLKGKRIGLCNDESTVNTFLHNITKDNYMHNVITGQDVSIGYKNKTENSYISFYIKYASASSYNFMNEISLYDSGYRPIEEYYTCTEDFIVTSISAGWDDILMIIDEVPLLSTKEDKSNKVTSILSSSTNDQYPTARAIVDYVNEKIVQSDYNQNDSTAKDYIKNRPFYEISNIIFQGDVTFTKDGEFEVYSGTIPFSTSFKKDDFKKVWRLQILYEEKQEKLRRYSWNYENGQSNNFEYFSYFISSQGMAEVYWNGAHIVSSDTALKIDIPADGDTASTKTINITITMQTKSDTLDLMSLKDIEDIDRVLQGNPPR